MFLEIEFYGSTDSRLGYVEQFIQNECPDEIADLINEKFDLLRLYPINQCLKDKKSFEKVHGYQKRIGLYELKVNKREKYRLLFVIYAEVAWMLDAFIKTNSKDMRRHYEKAFQRARYIN